ncbi:MAG: hypothetical protein ABSH28_14515 [Acidobacteriota bacterium]|jgi:hypothetical protein
MKVGDTIDLENRALASGPRCASVAGYSVHADVCIPAHDRMRLEHLARYAGRPPLATERVSFCPTAGCCIASSAAGATGPLT